MLRGSINNLTDFFSTLRAGDAVYLDIDDTLLLSSLDRVSGTFQPTEKHLAEELQRLQTAGVSVYGLTARGVSYTEKTVAQLQSIGITLSEIIHAPSIAQGKNKVLQKGLALKARLDKLKEKPKRVIVVDDMEEQLHDIARECADYPLRLYHYVRPQQILTYANNKDAFPDTLDDYDQPKSLGGGTNSVHSLQNTNGDKLVLKHGAHVDAIKAEILCNVIYRTLGIAVPELAVYNKLPDDLAENLKMKTSHGIFQVAKYIDGTEDENVIRKAAKAHFIAHAVLGNIDVAKSDNFIVGKDGIAYLIDAGANFLFRALGEDRQEEPDLLIELDSLRDSKRNNVGYEWFHSLTEEELTQQTRDILNKQNELANIIWDVSEKLDMSSELRDKFLTTFTRRLSVLADHFHIPEQTLAQPDKPAIPDKTAAGILTYAMINGKPHVLLSQRVRHEWWDNFGGKSDAGDASLQHTAIREVAEESNKLLQYSEYELQHCPFHDLVSKKADGASFTYRMYLVEHAPINTNDLNDDEHTRHSWVPVDGLLQALQQKPVIVEGEATCEITVDPALRIALYAPLYGMLTQKPVFDHLQRLANKQL